jgi:hypothetical protein
MRSHLLLGGFAAALAASAIQAQTPTFTSPKGLDTVEGNSNHDYIMFRYNKMRFQQIDSTNTGAGPRVLKTIAWRRDGTVTGTARNDWVARTTDMTVILSEAVPMGSATVNFNTNYLGQPTTVFTTKNVNLPDWTALPTTPPAPFDFKLTLDVPWLYAGVNNFLWEVQSDNLSLLSSDYGNDYETSTGTFTPASNSGTILGVGCVVPPNTLPFLLSNTVYNHASKFRIVTSGSRGPANSPALLFADAIDSNLTVPGLCTTLHAMPTLIIPLGVTSGTGAIASTTTDNLAYDPSLVGAQVFFQAMALDTAQPGIPIALTHGRVNTIPNPPTPPVTARLYEYSTGTSMRAPSIWTGALVTQYEY